MEIRTPWSRRPCRIAAVDTMAHQAALRELEGEDVAGDAGVGQAAHHEADHVAAEEVLGGEVHRHVEVDALGPPGGGLGQAAAQHPPGEQGESGRPSCRERVCPYVYR